MFFQFLGSHGHGNGHGNDHHGSNPNSGLDNTAINNFYNYGNIIIKFNVSNSRDGC